MSPSGRPILLLLPHPDDEVVGCALFLRRAAAVGARLFALYLTTGVPAQEALFPWQRHGHARRVRRRRAESYEAARHLQLTQAGYLAAPTRRLKSHLADSLTVIRATIATHAIEEIWVPAFEGAHQDHDVTNFLGAQVSSLCPVREFAEYCLAGGRVLSGRFAQPNGSEETIALTAEEARWKRELLALYASARGNLRHVRCDSESMRPLPRYDYAARPHPGRLFYERFRWVPFLHPRVDFDPPERIAAALAAFAAAARS
jgi:LmbE family N-acetylglucosaminyl deacetylase